MSVEFPSRIDVGDGEGAPCRVVGFDFARGGDAVVHGRRDADGNLHVDRIGVPRPTMGELREFYENQPAARRPYVANPGAVGLEYFAQVRTSADFAVDVSATPNGCERCGELERGHGPDHGYAAPPDVLRLARMKTRREAGLHAREAEHTTLAALPDALLTITVDAAAVVTALQRLGEQFAVIGAVLQPVANAVSEAEIAAQRFHAQSQYLHLDTATAGTAWTVDDRDWPAQGNVCSHVCGPDPDHACDARATTTLRHKLPSGGTRTLPLCRPCADAETADGPADLAPITGPPLIVANMQRRLENMLARTATPPPIDRLFVVAATRVQFTEWCHELGISPQDRRVMHVTGRPGQLQGQARGLRYLVLGWPQGPGFAAVVIRDGLRSRDAVEVSDEEFVAWRRSLHALLIGRVSTVCVGMEFDAEHRAVLQAYREAHGTPWTAGAPTAVMVNQAVDWWNRREEAERAAAGILALADRRDSD